MVYFKQDKKMCDIKKSYSFHSVIVPANHLVIVRCFINKGCTVTELVFFSVLFIPIAEDQQFNEGCRRRCYDALVTLFRSRYVKNRK